jgi:hypothetical protein
MLPGPSRRTWRPPHLAGLLVAVLALVSQLALGAMVLPDDDPQAQLDALSALTVLCRTGVPATDRDQAPLHHRRADPALCPLSVALALPGVILTPAPVLPSLVALLTLRAMGPPPARAPPSSVPDAAFPRGPPTRA